jgi:hypothetical protein
MFFFDKNKVLPAVLALIHYQHQASDTSSSRPHTLVVAEGLIHEYRKASYTGRA